jgi:NAD(P)-dependent dehydrogenase (short-subunit alcohol dehydrogenase family)
MAEAVPWGKRGARVSTISPGIIITPLANDELKGHAVRAIGECWKLQQLDELEHQSKLERQVCSSWGRKAHSSLEATY